MNCFKTLSDLGFLPKLGASSFLVTAAAFHELVYEVRSIIEASNNDFFLPVRKA